MSAYADTGFIVTLYKTEASSAPAAALMRRQQASVWLSHLGELEFRNALHLAVFRGELTAAEAVLKKRLFSQDVANGIYLIIPVPGSALFAKAGELADRHSARLGTRSLDLMHVAAAILLGAKAFLSFDERQRKAARAEGLKVLPRETRRR
ncbi:MAG: type II toxin-antitoxin system VapC family toxin [Akkermansiaceae bacterium]|nr:type II toxin-antitoxin system VapC family toxin [Akkermansiaceae bacterium]MCF7733820.1 type II toxin-antitoxin system VapC family toxin [Akkermansiaceae bacterium]